MTWQRCICNAILHNSTDLCPTCQKEIYKLTKHLEKEEDAPVFDSDEEIEYLCSLFGIDKEDIDAY